MKLHSNAVQTKIHSHSHRRDSCSWKLAKVILVISISFLFSAFDKANAATVTEFDQATQEQRGEFVAVTLQKIFHYYRDDLKDDDKAACMEDLYQTKNSIGTPMLLPLILTQIDNARAHDPDEYKVEEIIFGVIEKECSDK